MGDKLPPPRPPPRRKSNNASGPPLPPSNLGTESPTLSRSTIPQDRRPKTKASFRSSIVAMPDPEMMQLETEGTRLSHATMKVDYQDILQRHSPTGSPEQNINSSKVSGESQQQATNIMLSQDEDDEAVDTAAGDVKVTTTDDDIPVNATATNNGSQAPLKEEDIFLQTDDSGVGPLEIQEEIRRSSKKMSVSKTTSLGSSEDKTRSVHFAETPLGPTEEGGAMTNNQDVASDNNESMSAGASDTTDIDDGNIITIVNTPINVDENQGSASVINANNTNGVETTDGNKSSNIYETTTNTSTSNAASASTGGNTGNSGNSGSSIHSNNNTHTNSIISSDNDDTSNKRQSTINTSSSRNKNLDSTELLASLEAILAKWTSAVTRAAESGVNKNIVTFAAASVGQLSPSDLQGLGTSTSTPTPTPPTTSSSQESVEENKSTEVVEAESADISTMKATSKAYESQIAILQESIESERQVNAESRRLFEEGLTTKYESLVDQLNTKVAVDHELRMKRAVDEIRRRNLNDSEKIIKLHELSRSGEDLINHKFKDIVTELHTSWENETKAHSKAIEERNRSHFKAVLGHMEKQLKTSLSLQNEVDTRWLEELDRRSQNQAETLFAFEEKCKQLYDERYKRYVSVNNKKMMSYQKQLTDTASSLSNEKSKYDSKLRRIKLGCLKWKTEYQRNISKKYEGALITLENRYSGEIERLLSELSEARAGVSKATRVLQENQTNYMSQRVNETNMNTLPSKTVTGQEATIAKANTATLCSDLLTSWEEQRVSTEERIAHMTQLLNEISITSEFVNKYQSVQSQVVGRMPIIELMSQKTYFEYKLKQINIGSVSSADKTVEMNDIRDQMYRLDDQIAQAINKYESQYKVKFQISQ